MLARICTTYRVRRNTIIMGIFHLNVVAIAIRTRRRTERLISMVVRCLHCIIIGLLKMKEYIRTCRNTIRIRQVNETFDLRRIRIKRQAKMIVLSNVNIRTSRLCLSNSRARIKVTMSNLVNLITHTRAIIITRRRRQERLRFRRSFSYPLRFTNDTRIKSITTISCRISTILTSISIVCNVRRIIRPLITITSRNGPSNVLTLRHLLCLLCILNVRVNFTLCTGVMEIGVRCNVTTHGRRNNSASG